MRNVERGMRDCTGGPLPQESEETIPHSAFCIPHLGLGLGVAV